MIKQFLAKIQNRKGITFGEKQNKSSIYSTFYQVTASIINFNSKKE